LEEEKVVRFMNVNREELKRMIDHISEQEVAELLDFIGYLNMKREREALKNLEQASLTSMDFWDNPVDDEVWNDV
jgi:23S rRNA maturation mini-RNase III